LLIDPRRSAWADSEFPPVARQQNSMDAAWRPYYYL
jgi:hypothetical protein